MDDRQLGQRLVAALPAGTAPDPEQLLAALRDLLPADDPRLEPLTAMAQRPEFLALAIPPQANRPGQTQADAQEEALLRSLSVSHRPEMVARLKAVLKGVREQGASRSSHVMELMDRTSVETSRPISETTWQQFWESLHSAPDPSPNASTEPTAPETTSQEPSTTPMVVDPPSEQPRREGHGRAVRGVLGAVAVTGALAAGALTALRANVFCASLGLCSVEVIDAATAALEKAEQTAMRLNKATAITDYDQATQDLERQVRRIERDGVFSEAQRNSLKTLQDSVNRAVERSKRENADHKTVQEVRAKSGTVQSLPWRQAEKRRLQYLQRLQPIAPNSFSYREAQALRQQLQPPPPIPTEPREVKNPPPSEEPASSYRQPAQAKPPSEPLLDWRRVSPRKEPTNDWRGWSRPRQQPPPAPVDQGSDDAPYRKEPLW
jgi:hypothetical protein